MRQLLLLLSSAVAEHVYTVLSCCDSMFVALPVTPPEWCFAGHLGAFLARYGVIITSTGRITAAVVACQCLFDTWSRVSVFIIFGDASALLLMRCSPLPVRRLPGCGSRCSARYLAGTWKSCGWAPGSGGLICPRSGPRWVCRNAPTASLASPLPESTLEPACYSLPSKKAVLAGRIIMPPTVHERIYSLCLSSKQ
jgi:hypothetical protein